MTIIRHISQWSAVGMEFAIELQENVNASGASMEMLVTNVSASFLLNRITSIFFLSGANNLCV